MSSSASALAAMGAGRTPQAQALAVSPDTATVDPQAWGKAASEAGPNAISPSGVGASNAGAAPRLLTGSNAAGRKGYDAEGPRVSRNAGAIRADSSDVDERISDAGSRQPVTLTASREEKAAVGTPAGAADAAEVRVAVLEVKQPVTMPSAREGKATVGATAADATIAALDTGRAAGPLPQRESAKTANGRDVDSSDGLPREETGRRTEDGSDRLAFAKDRAREGHGATRRETGEGRTPLGAAQSRGSAGPTDVSAEGIGTKRIARPVPGRNDHRSQAPAAPGATHGAIPTIASPQSTVTAAVRNSPGNNLGRTVGSYPGSRSPESLKQLAVAPVGSPALGVASLTSPSATSLPTAPGSGPPPSPAQSQPPPVAAGTGSASVPQEQPNLQRTVVNLAASGGGKVSVTLRPPALGSVHVQMTISPMGATHIQLIAATHEGYSALTAAGPALVQHLASAGVTVGSFSTALQSGFGRGHGREPPAAQRMADVRAEAIHPETDDGALGYA